MARASADDLCLERYARVCRPYTNTLLEYVCSDPPVAPQIVDARCRTFEESTFQTEHESVTTHLWKRLTSSAILRAPPVRRSDLRKAVLVRQHHLCEPTRGN